MNTRQRNILNVWSQATPNELRDGLLWYRKAHNAAVFLASHHGISLEQSAGMIAAVSPGLRWERNLECAERIMCGFNLDGLGVRWYDGIRKAERILQGENPAVVLKGNKVRSFWANIKNPDDRMSVCIDGHAYAIASGKRVTLDDVPNITSRMYNRLVGDYIAAANAADVVPCQMQAVSWVVWRRLHNVADNGTGRKQAA